MALLELHRVSKTFPGTQALHQVSLDIQLGEVHALVGENGAGKSTLIKLLSGVYLPDSGAILLDGKTITLDSPQAAQRLGIRTLHQETSLIADLTVAENILLGAEPRRKWLPFINWKAMHARASELMAKLGVVISPYLNVDALGIAEQQIVELAKLFHVPARLLILDEPTAPLQPSEAKALFRIIKALKAEQVSILYITHRLDEVFSVADRVSVLRDGRLTTTQRIADCSTEQLMRLMSGRVGHPVNRERNPAPEGTPILRMEKFSRAPAFEDISFSLYPGEILGIAGPIGSGKTALARAIFGFVPATSGEIYVDDTLTRIKSPQDAIRLGIGFLPEDRREDALLPDMSALENMSLTMLNNSGPLIDREQELALVERYVRLLRIKLPDVATEVQNLSGGTQQKIVISRWLAVRSRILICDEATRGIDVNAKVEIHRILAELARQGTAILLVSSETAELAALCDRIVIMKNGHQVGMIAGADITEQALSML